ncbi:MAG: hypothetical protein HYU51_16145 [Candidatus Rokubacteria bacterium]|nr:hypothetical protein [Candidatus Rokubacteria bacterium]
MQPFSDFALAASILTCALGAIILCVLAYRYGFGDVTEEASQAMLHRAYMTRLGHVAGVVCFAVAAGFTIVALAVQLRAPATPPTVRETTSPDVARQLERLEQTRADQAELAERLRMVGERLQSAEATIGRLRSEQARMVRERLQGTEAMIGRLRSEQARMVRERLQGTEAMIERLRSEQARIVARVGKVETASATLSEAERSARSRPAPPASASPRPATPAMAPARTAPPAAPRPPSSAATPAASPPGSTPVASPQPAPAISGPPAPPVIVPPSESASPGSAPLGGAASESGRASAVPPDSARGQGAPASQPPADAAQEDQDVFVQAQRAMHSAGSRVTKHVERFAKDVKDTFVHFGRSVRSAFE